MTSIAGTTSRIENQRSDMAAGPAVPLSCDAGTDSDCDIKFLQKIVSRGGAAPFGSIRMAGACPPCEGPGDGSDHLPIGQGPPQIFSTSAASCSAAWRAEIWPAAADCSGICIVL